MRQALLPPAVDGISAPCGADPILFFYAKELRTAPAHLAPIAMLLHKTCPEECLKLPNHRLPEIQVGAITGRRAFIHITRGDQ